MSKHPHSPGGTLSHLKTATGHITPGAKQELYQKLYRKTKKMYFQSGSERVHWLSWPALLRASGTLTANARFHLFSAELMKYRLQKKTKTKPPPKDVCYTLARIGQKRNSEETGSCKSYSAGQKQRLTGSEGAAADFWRRRTARHEGTEEGKVKVRSRNASKINK